MVLKISGRLGVLVSNYSKIMHLKVQAMLLFVWHHLVSTRPMYSLWIPAEAIEYRRVSIILGIGNRELWYLELPKT